MFLDPAPKTKDDSRPSSRNEPLYSPQGPKISPRDEWLNRRKVLSQRSQSQINERPPKSSPEKRGSKAKRTSTVRLVKPSPSPSPSTHRMSIEEANRELALLSHDNWESLTVEPRVTAPRESLFADTKSASASEPGFPASRDVSDADWNLKPARNLAFPPSVILPTTANTPFSAKPNWHHRSASSKTSASSTLQCVEPSDVSFAESQDTTLQGSTTATRNDRGQSISLITEDEAESLSKGPLQILETLEEASPERKTVRAVSPASSTSKPQTPYQSSLSIPSLPQTPVSPLASDSSDEQRSLGSDLSNFSPSAIVRPQRANQVSSSEHIDEAPRARADISAAPSSSPNFVVYVDASQPVTIHQLLRSVSSFEDILSRRNTPSYVRPDTGLSITTSDWASLRRASVDTLPPLQVPRRRLRHTHGSISGTLFGTDTSPMYDDFDPLPWPRQPLHSHLSTIASESDRSDSQHLSHFSLGSGVLTGDDASSMFLSSHRRGSAPLSTHLADDSPVQQQSSEGIGEDAQGDIPIGMFRAESAKPDPLLRARNTAEQAGTKRYDGPLPPMPPMPNESDEIVDTVGDLTRPQLREKRSGYSIRQRSNSTPSRSISQRNSRVSTTDTERWSHGSSIFPIWAKNFYVHNAPLLSSSKISLSNPPTPQNRNRTNHIRNASQWTERSITSRLGTGYSELTSSSLSSSRFLPSIFRPRNRARSESKFGKSRTNSRPSADNSSRPDSLAILSADDDGGETLPSGHPKYGSLKDASAPPVPQPLPGKYSKQKHWDSMSFPRPMTKDRLSEFSVEPSPHLVPNRQTATNKLSAWRAPSFVESLDTLFRSRGNRQILLFALGFLCPLAWMLAGVLPLPPRPTGDTEKRLGSSSGTINEDEEGVEGVLRRHEQGEAGRRWAEERTWLKAKWWRTLNRVMSVVGVLVLGAVIALAIVATRR